MTVLSLPQTRLNVPSSNVGLPRAKRGDRWLTPSLYRFLLALHVVVSVGWLGTTFAKLVLGVAAVTASAPDGAAALYGSSRVLDIAFPMLAIPTIVSGVLLSLGTKWGLLTYYWIVTKLVLTVGVIVTAVQLSDRLVRQAISGVAIDPAASIAAASTVIVALAATHLTMLAVATIVSIYKPWGKTWYGRRAAARAGAVTEQRGG